MLLSVLRHIRNYFDHTEERGDFSLVDSNIILQGEYKIGQYILITGSILVNGVYKIVDIAGKLHSLESADGTASDIVSENFNGVIYGLVIPPDFLNIVNDIKAFVDEQGAPTNIRSETNQNYRWESALDKNGNIAGWEQIFSTKLAPFKKMFTTIKI